MIKQKTTAVDMKTKQIQNPRKKPSIFQDKCRRTRDSWYSRVRGSSYIQGPSRSRGGYESGADHRIVVETMEVTYQRILN